VKTESRPYGWIKFITGLFVLYILFYWIAPVAVRLTGHERLRPIAEDGIRITGIYYTDVDVCSEAQRSLGDKLRYAIPRDKLNLAVSQ
jgi:hypothetical protein